MTRVQRQKIKEDEIKKYTTLIWYSVTFFIALIGVVFVLQSIATPLMTICVMLGFMFLLTRQESVYERITRMFGSKRLDDMEDQQTKLGEVFGIKFREIPKFGRWFYKSDPEPEEQKQPQLFNFERNNLD